MKNKKIFWRAVFLSGVIFFNIVLLIAGISVAYENIQSVFKGEYVEAVEVTDEEIRILDFHIPKGQQN